jgi:predicted nuclease of predicted toxin-antitoxin system
VADFLVDASLPRATGDLIRAYGHQATDVRDIGLGTAADQDIAEHARLHQRAVISGDQDFGNVLLFPPANRWMASCPCVRTIAQREYLRPCRPEIAWGRP